jgi:hypothetical protein
LSSTLLPQLLCLIYRQPSINCLSLLANSPTSCPLFALFRLDDALDWPARLSLFSHCRLEGDRYGEIAKNLPTFLERAADSIRKSDESVYHLSRLSLPTSFLEPDLAVESAIEAVMQALTEVCERRGVEVVFEGGREEFGEPFIPLRTVEYAEKLKEAGG